MESKLEAIKELYIHVVRTLEPPCSYIFNVGIVTRDQKNAIQLSYFPQIMSIIFH